MTDLVLGIGLVLAVEGLLFAAFPGFIRRRMAEVAGQDEGHLRVAGLAAAVGGILLVWLARRVLG
ncbi:DUF2065 domain-containing protein [Alsobacter sp. R-9]